MPRGLPPEVVDAKTKQLGLNVSEVAEHTLRTYVQTLQHGDQSSSSAIATPVASADDGTPTPNAAQHAEASVEEILADYGTASNLSAL